MRREHARRALRAERKAVWRFSRHVEAKIAKWYSLGWLEHLILPGAVVTLPLRTVIKAVGWP